MKLCIDSGKYYVTATYDTERVEFIASLVRPGDCFWDVGAHRGYVTLIAARRVGPSGRVFSFEPSAKNRWYINKHLAWNHVDNVTVVPAAIRAEDGQAAFPKSGSAHARLGAGEATVSVRSVASLIAGGDCAPPTFVKIDVEGCELGVLNGAGEYLRNPRMLILVGTHSRQLHDDCVSLLNLYGYTTVESARAVQALAEGWETLLDVDTLAIGPDRDVPEKLLAFFKDRC
jgi:FkbM family methyltransferase